MDNNNNVKWQNRACNAGSCSFSNGCNDNEISNWFNELVEPDYRISCGGNSCKGFCVDATTQQPNGKVLYNPDKEMKDKKDAMNTKDWDGVMSCVADSDECATRSYNVFEDSGSGHWCKPDTNTKYQCWDLPCQGMQNFVSDVSSITPNDMTWRCSGGTCYPDCANIMFDKVWVNFEFTSIRNFSLQSVTHTVR